MRLFFLLGCGFYVLLYIMTLLVHGDMSIEEVREYRNWSFVKASLFYIMLLLTEEK
jgi:hypothetical protein